jgi:hypothetical protein
MKRIPVILAVLFLMLPEARGALEPPRLAAAGDSGSVTLEHGVEYVRVREYMGLFKSWPKVMTMTASARWMTEWQTPEGGGDRLRQDGRWYFGISRPIYPMAAIWLAGSGEHFDDRPFGNAEGKSRDWTAVPNSPLFADHFSLQSANVVRLLRGAAGASVHPWKPLTADVGIGPMQDKRIGSNRSGIGIWSRAGVEGWNVSGYDQTFSVLYNRETPTHHTNEDIGANYRVFREFYPGQTNLAEISAGKLERDVFLDPARTAHRLEQNVLVRDDLVYGLTQNVTVNMTGDLQHQKTQQSLAGAITSALEENQAGIQCGLEARQGGAIGEILIGTRTVTQTIRGDVLQGRKTDLSLSGRLPMPWTSRIAVRAAVSKYSLDTRSDANHDDRDELRYDVNAAWSKPLFASVVYELKGTVQLDHLVYLFRENSANNRWTRYFLAGSSIRHQPVPQFSQTVEANVAANYQDYDFETDPESSRSTIHRRWSAGDSLTWELHPRWAVRGKFYWQMEEFGRLFWDSFEEERSDEIRALSTSLEVMTRIIRPFSIAAGALWDNRRGERFHDNSTTLRTVFQDLTSYGPILRIDYLAAGPFFFAMNGRVLRQFQLGRNDRWITTGDIRGGYRW